MLFERTWLKNGTLDILVLIQTYQGDTHAREPHYTWTNVSY